MLHAYGDADRFCHDTANECLNKKILNHIFSPIKQTENYMYFHHERHSYISGKSLIVIK